MKQHEHIQYIVNNAIEVIGWVYPDNRPQNIEFDYEYLKEKYTLSFDVIIKNNTIKITDVIIWKDATLINITDNQIQSIINEIKQNFS